MKKFFYTDYIDINEFSNLDSIFSQLYSNDSIIDKISNSIIDENTIDDNASKELSNIRRKQRNIEQDIKSKLNTYLHSSSYSKYVQENVVTIRNNRYVIPIKEEYRRLGIATKLMNKAEEIAKQEDITKIWLFSGFHRKNAHELYRKLGYDENRDKAFVKQLLK